MLDRRRLLPAFAPAFVGLGLLTQLVARVGAASEPEFPYIAYVADSDALVRSGPGRKHYATAQLPAGFAVEVYRHDGNGWCAIRPPEGSFSLVALREVQPLHDRTAQVASDGVAVRVGSALGDERSAVQVMLQRGEPVGLLEPPSPTNPWVRIAPPAGEFRWIAASRLSRNPPTETPRDAAPAGPTTAGWQSPAVAASGSATAAIPAPSMRLITTPEPSDEPAPGAGDPFAHLARPVEEAPTPLPAVATAGNPAWGSQALAVDPRSSGAIAPASTAADAIEVIPGSPAAQQAPAGAFAAPSLPGDSAAPANGPPRVRFEGLTRPSGPLDPRVAEMQLRLSQIVIGAPASWQFNGLREEATALLAQEQTPECRDQLRDLVDRIATFEGVQARYRALPPNLQVIAAAGVAPGAPGAAGQVGGAPPDDSYASQVRDRVRRDLGLGGPTDNGITPTPGGPDSGAVEALYDAVGTLKPVVSRRQNAPQFALVDDQGDVVTLVTAAPDVNLQAYVGQRIGVRGNRGFMPEFRRSHVVASRVTNLEHTLVK